MAVRGVGRDLICMRVFIYIAQKMQVWRMVKSQFLVDKNGCKGSWEGSDMYACFHIYCTKNASLENGQKSVFGG